GGRVCQGCGHDATPAVARRGRHHPGHRDTGAPPERYADDAGGGAGVTDAIVVGSGPNGLSAAVTLARAGIRVTVLEAADSIGGGTRSAQLTQPGLIHDVCSAFHPTAVASAFLRSLRLEEHGLEWLWPPVDLAHPLDDGPAPVLTRSMDETVARLGTDGPAWRRLFGPLAGGFDELADELLGPVLHVPRRPVR